MFLPPDQACRDQGTVDLITQLATSICNARPRIDCRGTKTFKPFFPKILGDAAEVFESEYLATAVDAVDQNDVHRTGI